jgi:hypothetical protein
VLTSACI